MSKKSVKRSCLGKKKYKYSSIAEYELSNHRTRINLETYNCNFCNYYHIGKISKK